MSRINLDDVLYDKIETTGIVADELSVLIDDYFENNANLKQYKKVCDDMNTKIKESMADLDITEKETGKYVAKMSTERRESFDEDKLIEVLEKYAIFSPIKTKKYVDMDVLEDILYKGVISNSLVEDLDRCKIVKEIVKLRVSKKKAKKE